MKTNVRMQAGAAPGAWDLASWRELARDQGTPIYVYDEALLLEQARRIQAIPAPYGLTVRYAMKANPNRAVLAVLERAGLHFDASSEYEALRLLRLGVAGEKIQLTSQQMAREHVHELQEAGVRFNACSLRQIRAWGELFPGSEISLRLNPGVGSGSTRKTDVGGPTSSFGIWHEYCQQAVETAGTFGLRVRRLHSHIGSGTDPKVWAEAAKLTLELANYFGEIDTVNLGGGFKVARMPEEKSADIELIGQQILAILQEDERVNGRQLHLELEPGTFMTANAGYILARVDDIVDTGAQGLRFVKLDVGMDSLTRPALYGARHPITVIPASDGRSPPPVQDYAVCGHCCESGDLLTVGAGEVIETRPLPAPSVGDLVVIGGTGAYCAGMSLGNYNSYPLPAELMVRTDSTVDLIRRRQRMDQILANEIPLS